MALELITRAEKGSPLTYEEMDNNFLLIEQLAATTFQPTTAAIADSTNKRYVTDQESTLLQNIIAGGGTEILLRNLVAEVNSSADEERAFDEGALFVIRLDLLNRLIQSMSMTGVSRLLGPPTKITKKMIGQSNLTVQMRYAQTGKSALQYQNQRQQRAVSSIVIQRTKAQSGKANMFAFGTKLKDQTGKSLVQTQSKKALIGVAKIGVISYRDQHGLSSIAVSLNKAMLGLAKVTATTSTSQRGKASLYRIVAANIIGKSTIMKAVSQEQVGKSKLFLLNQRGIAGSSNIRVTSSKAQSGRANIGTIFRPNQIGKSSVLKTSLTNLIGKSNITATTKKQLLGISKITNFTVVKNTGKSAIVNTVVRQLIGKSKVTATASKQLFGKGNITKIVLVNNTGKSKISLLTQKAISGKSKLNIQTQKAIAGKAHVNSSSQQWQRQISGRANLKNNTLKTQMGKANIASSGGNLAPTSTLVLSNWSEDTSLSEWTLNGMHRINTTLNTSSIGPALYGTAISTSNIVDTGQVPDESVPLPSDCNTDNYPNWLTIWQAGGYEDNSGDYNWISVDPSTIAMVTNWVEEGIPAVISINKTVSATTNTLTFSYKSSGNNEIFITIAGLPAYLVPGIINDNTWRTATVSNIHLVSGNNVMISMVSAPGATVVGYLDNIILSSIAETTFTNWNVGYSSPSPIGSSVTGTEATLYINPKGSGGSQYVGLTPKVQPTLTNSVSLHLDAFHCPGDQGEATGKLSFTNPRNGRTFSMIANHYSPFNNFGFFNGGTGWLPVENNGVVVDADLVITVSIDGYLHFLVNGVLNSLFLNIPHNLSLIAGDTINIYFEFFNTGLSPNSWTLHNISVTQA